MRLLLVAALAAMAVNGEVLRSPSEVDDGDGSFLALSRCLLHIRKLECAERRASTALRKLRREEADVSLQESTSDLEKQLADAAADVFSPQGKTTEAEGN